MKLKLFSDQFFLPERIAHEPILYPFWGEPPNHPDFFPPGASWWGAFDRYIESGRSLFEMTSLEDADLVVLPGNLEKVFDPEYLALATELIEKAKQFGKPTAGFFWGDCSHVQLPVTCNFVFRNAPYRSMRTDCDFTYPTWNIDLVKQYFNGNLPVRQKSEKPIVGFCGFVGKNGPKTYAKRLIYNYKKLIGKGFPPPPYVGNLLRHRAISLLENSRFVETNFVFRGSMGFSTQLNNTQEYYRETYIQNMQESDYILCCRGYGNYSFRFCEALSCGKIPVFVDTDCVLPFDFEIDWKKSCVWVTERELPMIAEKLAEFHSRLSAQEFVDLQHKCRRIWQEMLSPEGFFANLHKHLLLKQSNGGKHKV
jgi:hypothetical protein